MFWSQFFFFTCATSNCEWHMSLSCVSLWAEFLFTNPISSQRFTVFQSLDSRRYRDGCRRFRWGSYLWKGLPVCSLFKRKDNINIGKPPKTLAQRKTNKYLQKFVGHFHAASQPPHSPDTKTDTMTNLWGWYVEDTLLKWAKKCCITIKIFHLIIDYNTCVQIHQNEVTSCCVRGAEHGR